MLIGNKNTVAFDIIPPPKFSLCTVNIIIGNRSVCCDDNSVYLPQFTHDLNLSLKRLKKNEFDEYPSYLNGKSCEEIHWFLMSTRDASSENHNLENDRLYPAYQFMDWGPTTDNIFCFLFQNGKRFTLSYQFWREEHYTPEEIEKVNCVEIDKAELISTLSEAVAKLTNLKR